MIQAELEFIGKEFVSVKSLTKVMKQIIKHPELKTALKDFVQFLDTVGERE